MDNHKSIWNNCLKIIKVSISENDFNKFFRPIEAYSLKNNKLTIKVPSQYYYEYIENNFIKELKGAIFSTLGPSGKIDYAISINSSSNKVNINYPSSSPINKSNRFSLKNEYNDEKEILNPFVIPGVKKIQIDSNLNSNYIFDNLVKGDCNFLAYTTAMAVSENPGKTSFNPYFVYGDVSLGKTHLINAIGNRIKKKFPEKNVLYVQAEDFTQQFINAIQNNRGADFKNFYQLLDVLIIDDIQFLCSKKKTQETFFHILNHLYYIGKQIIISSDINPSELGGVQERILSRFQVGLVADLHYPDYETRMNILKMKSTQQGIVLSEEVLELIAKKVIVNIRQLEGVMVSLLARSMVERRIIDKTLVESVIKNISTQKEKKIDINEIKKIVSEYFEIKNSDFDSKSRKRELVKARQFAMYFSKKYTRQSLQKIGEVIGKKNHATVLHSCNVVKDQSFVDKEFKKQLQDVEEKIIKYKSN